MAAKGIESDLMQRLREALSKCGSWFNSDQELRAVFTDSRIRAWRDGVPEASNSRQRIDLCITYVHLDRLNKENESNLALFLEVLRDGIPSSDDYCYDQLNHLAQECRSRFVEQVTSSTAIQPPTHGLAARTSGLPKPVRDHTASNRLIDWLTNWGFMDNPFKERCWVAEQDTSTPTEAWFKEPANYIVDIRGGAEHPGAKYILAPFGAGKTALLDRLYHDLSDPGHDVLPVKYLVLPDQFRERCEANREIYAEAQSIELVLFTHGQMVFEELSTLNTGGATPHLLAPKLVPRAAMEVYSPWRQILSLCAENGRRGVAVLVDIEVNRTSDIEWIMEDYVVPLGNMTLPGILIKVFAPIEQTRAREMGLRVDRGDVYTVQWDQRKLQELIQARIMGYRLQNVPGRNRLETQKEDWVTEPSQLDDIFLAASGEEPFNVSSMFEPEAQTTTVRQWFSEFVAKHPTPRAVLMLGYQILALHAETLPGHSQSGLALEPLISRDTISRAIATCERTLL